MKVTPQTFEPQEDNEDGLSQESNPNAGKTELDEIQKEIHNEVDRQEEESKKLERVEEMTAEELK